MTHVFRRKFSYNSLLKDPLCSFSKSSNFPEKAPNQRPNDWKEGDYCIDSYNFNKICPKSCTKFCWYQLFFTKFQNFWHWKRPQQNCDTSPLFVLGKIFSDKKGGFGSIKSSTSNAITETKVKQLFPLKIFFQNLNYGAKNEINQELTQYFTVTLRSNKNSYYELKNISKM